MGLLPIVPTEAEKMQRDRCAKTHPHIWFFIKYNSYAKIHFTFYRIDINSGRYIKFLKNITWSRKDNTFQDIFFSFVCSNFSQKCHSNVLPSHRPAIEPICIRSSNESIFRNYVCEVLKKVLHEIRNHRRFDSLQEEINNIAKKQEGERNLEETAQMRLNQAEQLREHVESDKKANEEDRKRMTELAQESDALVDHAIFLNSGKLGNA